MTILTRKERRILAAFAEAILDRPTPTIPYAIETVGLVDRIDTHLRYFSADGRWTYRAFLWVLECSAWFYYRAPLRLFSQMPLVRRQQYLTAWRRSPWSPKRLLKRFLEAIVMVNYYAIPEVAVACGYRPQFKPPAARPPLRPERLFRTPPSPIIDEPVEVVVIGSGAGGAVVAETLARRGHDTVIVEEGDVASPADFGVDLLRFTQRYYRNAGVSATYGWPTILVPTGKVVGGTTVVNSGTCLRVSDAVFQRWADEFGLVEWGRDMGRRYADVETRLHVTPVPDDLQGPHATLFRRGAERLGYPVRPLPRNVRDCQGSGVCCFGCPTNAKLNMALTYLPSALEHGARLYANAKVRRIVWSGHTATGVTGDFVDPSTGARRGTFQFRPKMIVVACGSLHTPVLLHQSGVPDVWRHIGRHLTLHPATKALALFDEPVRAWEGVPQGMAVEDVRGEGILMESIFTPPAQCAMGLLLEGRAHREIMEQYDHLAAFGFMVSDTSEGRIFHMPNGHAIAYYRVRQEDLPKFVRGMRALTEIFFAAGARKVFPGLYPCPTIDREEGVGALDRLRLRAKDLDLQAWHPLGTCRMASTARQGALDPTGQLYGLNNLYVADGSIFPTALGVNPQITIMAAASRIGEGISDRLGARSPRPS